MSVSSLISFVVPTRNEPQIQDLLRSIGSVMDGLDEDFEMMVVDRSDDDTPLRARKMGARVHRQLSKGLGGALKEGFNLARGSIVFTMDADLSHDPAHIPRFLEEIGRGFDIVVGSRKVEGGGVIGWGLRRKATSWGANMIGRFLAGVDVSDLTSGYRAYKADVINSLDLEGLGSSGYAFQLEVLSEALRRGFSVGVVPIVFRDRMSGESKLRVKDIVEFLKVSLRLLLRRFR